MSPVVVTGDKQAKALLRNMARRTEDMRPAWPSVGSYISRTVRRQFTTRGAALGTPWAPLKPETRRWKAAHGFPRSVLVMDGQMRNSWTRRPMSIEIYAKQSATFGSNDRKTVWHQYGTRRNGKRVNPPRPMFKVTREVRRDIKDIVQKRIIGRKAKVV